MAMIPVKVLSIEPNPVSQLGGVLNMVVSNAPLKSFGLDVDDVHLFSPGAMGVISTLDGETYPASLVIFEPPYTEITIQIPPMNFVPSPGSDEMICSIAFLIQITKTPDIAVTINGRDMLRVKRDGASGGGEISISNILPKTINGVNLVTNGATFQLTGTNLDTAVRAVFTNNARSFNVAMIRKSSTALTVSIPPDVDAVKTAPFKWNVALTDHNGKVVHSPFISLVG